MRFLLVLALVASCCVALAGQDAQSAAPTSLPKLERFSPNQVDKSLDPCNDFFQFACSKWNAANPIPPDQAAWGTFNALDIWNIAALHNTLETAAAASNPGPIEKQVGDYYSACMDESA
jgi:putative endopeptidase